MPVEIMSPVGSYESLSAAIAAGAGSVYFGVGAMNMRSRSAANFSLEDLANIVRICKEHQVKSYLTVNTIIYNDEIQQMHELLDAAKACGVTAIIASDMAVIQYAREKGIEIHLSTQCNVTNVEAVRYYAQFADVIVLGRECQLRQVADICQAIGSQQIKGPKGELVKIEIFVHGALCMAVSGRCYLSLDNYNSPANRGACYQPCRRAFTVQDGDGAFIIISPFFYRVMEQHELLIVPDQFMIVLHPPEHPGILLPCSVIHEPVVVATDQIFYAF